MNVSTTITCNNNQPIISICIPTYNRASCLENLLKNLAEIKMVHGNAIEICISNNQSTDGTAQIIANWQNRLDIKVTTQTENIGATMNFLAVTRIAKGKWLMIIGDNDMFIPINFAQLLKHLLTSDKNDWILTGVADGVGIEHHLGTRVTGRYDAKSVRRITLQSDLNGFGFVGMHIFPSILQQEFASLSPEQAQPWPHLALFFRHIQRDGYVQIYTTPIVQQSGGGDVLFWSIEAMVHITLRKMNVISEVRRVVKNHRWFLDALLLRELYSVRNIRTLMFWKGLEPDDFNHRALHEYFIRYRLLSSPFVFLVALHTIFLLLVNITPSFIIRVMLFLLGQKKSLGYYSKTQEKAISNCDGIKRGI